MKSSTVSAERLLRPAEVADLLDVSRHTLKAWRHRDGYGPHYKRLPGERGEIRHLLSEVLEFMRSDLHESYAAEVSRRVPDAHAES
jgi:predicted site-specific integrase-resolvase